MSRARSIQHLSERVCHQRGWECCLLCLPWPPTTLSSLITNVLPLRKRSVSMDQRIGGFVLTGDEVQASFHCLRLSNFLIRPSLESLQALLIIGFVLANDMKAEASWALIGLTCRLAQALGLHRGPNESNRIANPATDDLPRRKLWCVSPRHSMMLKANKPAGGR